MEWLLKHLSVAAKIIAWLSLKKVFLLGLTALGGIVMYTAYEQRSQVIEVFAKNGPKTNFTVSTVLQDRIKATVMTNPLITTVTVLAADLKLNERDIVYRFSDSAVANELWEKQFKERGTRQPIFTKDPENNAQMVSVVNGEFTCHSFAKTLNQNLVPEAAKITPVICRVSLPPYYGDFAGYLTLSLSRVPTEVEEDELQLEAKRLANEIFFKNIINR